MILTSTLAIPVVVISTVATVIFIGLGFLPTPSRATVLWATAFATAMVASYVFIAADITDSIHLRGLSVALMIAPMALIWSGLRAYREAQRQYLWLALTILVLTPAILVTASFTPAYGIVFRILFSATAILAAFTILELRRLGPAVRTEVLPLLAVSALFIVVAVIVVVNGVLVASGVTATVDSMLFIRGINLIGSTGYIVCCLSTTLLLATRASGVGMSARFDVFDSVARDRLARAEEATDPWWSMLDIRLDDPGDIRAASSAAAFNATADRFSRDVRSALPADADIEHRGPTRILALVPRAQGGMREILTALLERISTVDSRQPVPIRLSASIGWAPAQVVGYDLDALIASASVAVNEARAAGGDRWERVRGEG